MAHRAGHDRGMDMSEKPVPKKWDEYEFPDWIPEDVRRQLREFWNESWGRGPHEWIKSNSAHYNDHPALGIRVEAESLFGSGSTKLVGRWIPMWNNIGRVLLDDGTVMCSSTCGIRVLGEHA
jgi:hypothetical protein